MSVVAEDRRQRGVVVVAPEGDLDLLTCPAAGRAMRAGVDRDACQMLIVDLTRVTFLGVAALAVLVELLSRAVGRGVELRLVVSTRSVSRPLKVTGLYIEFTVYDSLASAIKTPRGGHFARPPSPLSDWSGPPESMDGRRASQFPPLGVFEARPEPPSRAGRL